VAELIYTAPLPTYFVTYSGALTAGPSGADPYSAEPFTIKNLHKRQEDSADNKLVRVLIQNVSASTSVIVAVLDEANTECVRINQFSITGGVPQEIITDTKLKLAAVFGYGNALFQVMAFYEKPLNR
jgi:hypothetical protein